MDDDDIQDTMENGVSDDAEQLHKQLKEAQEEARTNLGGWQRAQADFENYKKRKENENQELVIFAREVTVAKLLPTIDTLEQGLKHMPELPADADATFADQYKKWQDGIKGTLEQLAKVLEEIGVRKIEAVGKRFDPYRHEAVREVPGDEDGIVMEEYQCGYELNGKIIRPSQVVISKKQS